MVVLNARRDTAQSVFDAGQARVAAVYNECDTVSVSFSGGKDSTCVLHLAQVEAIARGQKVKVFFMDEEVVDPDTLAYCERVRNDPNVEFYWLCLPTQHSLRSDYRPYWTTWDPAERDVWVRTPPPWAITELAGWKAGMHLSRINKLLFPSEQYGKVGVFMGIRVDESMNRRRALMASGDFRVMEDPNHMRANPIYDWVTTDVWRYIHKNKLDYSRNYDKRYLYGISAKDQRVAPMGNVASLVEGTFYQEAYPDFWEKAIQRLPELVPAARYGRSKLYRKGQGKPPGWTWKEWTFYLVDQLVDPAQQEMWLKEIAYYQKKWREVASVPFPETPLAGMGRLSWKALATIVAKNDYLGRDKGALW